MEMSLTILEELPNNKEEELPNNKEEELPNNKEEELPKQEKQQAELVAVVELLLEDSQ
jgi:hypothetical protein